MNELPIYLMQGQEGLLIYNENEKVQGLTPVERGVHSSFYLMSDLEGRGIEPDDCDVINSDKYAGEYTGAVEIAYMAVDSIEASPTASPNHRYTEVWDDPDMVEPFEI